MTISVVVVSGHSARGFGEELVVLCKQRAFPNRIRRADTDRSQTDAYGASKFRDLDRLLFCVASLEFE